MEFKGTKGDCRTYQLSNGNMKITSDNWKDFAEVEFTHQNNTAEKRRECLYNAYLIRDAFNIRQKINCDLPELLEQRNMFLGMLIKTNEVLLNDSLSVEQIKLRKEIEKLIKKATTI